ncbi:hypothetical protein AX14_000584 [Amanita brunnescens Koide BX004]|nr:hypothetical protein AX14_000584 [Amanita brunnescens Koide BX004]
MADEDFRTLTAVVEALFAETTAIRTTEPEEIRKLRTGSLDNKVGTNGQYFATWDFANGKLRDYSTYTWYPLLQLAEDPSFSIEQLGRFALALRLHLPSATTREQFVLAVRTYYAYTNQLVAWSFHYFPWNLGAQFIYQNPDHPATSLTDLSRRVHVREGRRIKLTWEPIGITADACLAINENRELCNDVIAALPFTVLQDHAVVSGESIYAWTPVVSTSKIQTSGNKLIVQYGVVTEDIESPVLGEVVPEHVDRLTEVGRRVLQSTFETKELIWLKVELT